MSVARPHSSLVASALSIYLSHSLQAALVFKTKLNSYYCDFGGSNPAYYPDSSYQRLEELVQYLQESICKPATLHALASRLAVIDHLKNSISWSVQGNTPSHQWGDSHKMHKRSADFLRFFTIAEDNNDVELCREWLVASKISDMASNVPNLAYTEYLPSYSADMTRLEKTQFISRYIVELMRDNSTVLSRGATAVANYYKERCEKLESLSYSVTRLQAAEKALTPADERIKCLYKLQCELYDYSRTQLTESRIPVEDLVVQHSARESQQTQMAQLRKVLEDALIKMDACEKLLTGTRPDDCADLKEKLAELHSEWNERLLRDIHEACQAGPGSTGLDVWKQLISSANTVVGRANALHCKCTLIVERTKLMSFYAAEAARAAQIRPNTQYHDKITECWELAHADAFATLDQDSCQLRASARHRQYAALAEGIFASAVTCHTQWERAVQRRDDKLADFWQRARERAWEVGCRSFEAMQTGADDLAAKLGAYRIVHALHHAGRALELTASPAAHPLAAAEAELRLLLADMYVTYTEQTKNDSIHRKEIRRATKLALEVVDVFCSVTQLEVPGILSAATATEEVQTALRWCARTLTTLHHLSRTDTSASEETWQGALGQVTATLTQLKADSGEPVDANVLTQGMFATDLHLKLLESSRGADIAGALWLGWLAAAFASALPYGRFLESLTKGVRARIVKFRLQLACELEAETVRASPALAQWLKSQWPQKKRGFPATSGRGAKSSDTTLVATDAMAAYRSAVLWKQQATAAAAGTPLRAHLADGSARWAALADHRLKWAEHGEHGKVENGALNIYAKKALAIRDEASELAVKAIEAGLRALQSGDTVAHAKCLQVCNDLNLLTAQDRYVFDATKRDRYYGMDSRERAVSQVMLIADHSLRAVTAGQDGRADIAAAWDAAAKAREKAMDRRYGSNVSYTLHYHCDEAVKSADALAEKARLLEAKAAKSKR